jgi:uncharacterized membrane protein
MSAFLLTASRWGGILTIIVLVIALLKQAIAFIGFLMFAIKAALIIAFVGLMLLIVLAMLRGRDRRRRAEEL